MDDDKFFERFACAPGLRLEAHERLMSVHFDNLSSRLARLEEAVERLENASGSRFTALLL